LFHHDNFLYKFLIRQSRQELVERPFRLVIVKCKAEEGKEYWLLIIDFSLSAKRNRTELPPPLGHRGFLSLPQTGNQCKPSGVP